uniref:Reverse transcriptase domain-containing protein n=1 Tax=Globisporangium ultimum (strain ATCC 200006 / CBS 805.95 / DAOM BR144) TaxID=431595 RepID=K3W8X8_GLOUD
MAGGVDSLNNDFYKDCEDVMVEVLLLAKVLATRLQDILLWIIGEAQQGFVRDRLMENAILIMQAALDKAYHNGAEGLDDAPGIAMLDFMKAYDTLDRNFLYLVLSKFGFGRQFVDLYLVNGELSAEWEVKSGIRQGCPLAPLLFIVAAEILALAVQQDPHLEDGTRHKTWWMQRDEMPRGKTI